MSHSNSGGQVGHGHSHSVPNTKPKFLGYFSFIIAIAILGTIIGLCVYAFSSKEKRESRRTNAKGTIIKIQNPVTLPLGYIEFDIGPKEQVIVDKQNLYYHFYGTNPVEISVVSSSKQLMTTVTQQMSDNTHKLPNPHRYLVLTNTGTETVTFKFFDIHQ